MRRKSQIIYIMTPEDKLLKKIKEWRDACKDATEKAKEHDVYDLGFFLTNVFLDNIITEYEDEKFGEL